MKPVRDEELAQPTESGNMNILIIALGRLKEKYLTDAFKEYEKRISAFGRVTLEELEPERLPDNPTEAEIERALNTEADKILGKIPRNSFTAALCIEGKQRDSVAFAGLLSDASLNGKSTAVFIIGSSYGLSERVKKAADVRLSMSEMTFPHQLARIMLMEQLYRAFTIISNRKYHK